MTILIAHRGFAVDARENTLEAYAAAQNAGADWIELDVRRTSDDVLVVHHDAHLSDGRVIVELAAEELPPHVPTLVDVFEACPDLGINVEIKNSPGDPDYDESSVASVAVAGLVAAYRSPADVLVTSFNPSSVERIQAVDPTIPVGLVTFDALDPLQLVERAAARGHTAILPYLALTTDRLVQHAHRSGVAVYAWTVNDDENLARMLDIGVDGLITDRVDLARIAIDGRRGDHAGRSGTSSA
jgi:glycerophosphoryl diester phosphodiesterase